MPPMAQELLLLLDQKLLPELLLLLPELRRGPRARSRLEHRSSLGGRQRLGRVGSAGMTHIVACHNEALYACRTQRCTLQGDVRL